MNIYDETTGDTDNDIPAGTAFTDLQNDYHCTLCEAGKEDFKAVDLVTLHAINA